MGQYLPWTGPICLPLSQGGVWSMKLCPPGLGIPPNKIDLLWLLLAETLARCKILFRTHQGANYNPLSDSWPVLCHLLGCLFISLIDQVNESTTICRSLQYNLIASSAIANVFPSFILVPRYKLVHIDFFEGSYCTAKECVVHSQSRYSWWSIHLDNILKFTGVLECIIELKDY